MRGLRPSTCKARRASRRRDSAPAGPWAGWSTDGSDQKPMMTRPEFMTPYRFTRAELEETERFVIEASADLR